MRMAQFNVSQATSDPFLEISLPLYIINDIAEDFQSKADLSSPQKRKNCF